MRIFDRKPALRWLAPLTVLAVVGAAGALASVSASANPPLEPRTAEQLLVALQQAEVAGLSGTVEQTSALGIPELPDDGGGPHGTDTSLTSLVSGTHTLKVWYAGSDQARLAVLGTYGETDVIRNGNDLWTWSSKENTATHRTLEPHEKADEGTSPYDSMTPEAVARKLLGAVGPTTKVTTNGTATVAGRSAYELLLQPRDARSLISEVRIAVDSEESVPLRVQVVGSDPAPAFEVAYTDVSFDRPSADRFDFQPPAGSTVQEIPSDRTPDEEKSPRHQDGDEPTVVGTGWTTVVVAEVGDLAESDNEKLSQVLSALTPVDGQWGSGRLLAGPAFSLLITDDGRAAVGAVPPAMLYEALDK